MIRRLLLLNGLAVLAATLNHAIWELRPAMEEALQDVIAAGIDGVAARLSSPSFTLVQLLFLLVQVGVPAFLLVSGIFIAISTPTQAKTISLNQVLNRVKMLVIPYLIWTLVIMGVSIAQGGRFTTFELLNIFLIRGVIGPYYYVPMLVVYLLLTPFLVPLARAHAKPLLVGSMLVMFSLPAILYAMPFIHIPGLPELMDFFRAWRWLHNFFWFVLGMVVGFHKDEMRRLLQGRKFYLMALLPLAFMLSYAEINLAAMLYREVWIGPRNLFSTQVYVLIFLLTYLAWEDANFPFEISLGQLGVMSYGVYLLHLPVQQNLYLILKQSASMKINLTIAWIGVLFLVGLLVPVGLIQLIKRTPAQRFSRYLFG